ncbi:MAG: TlpA disulfide reductase family protein [Burkholderiales bacterium]|nr:TlpA disulfide reductase family protein [Burkholderiales bacterium]
MAMQSVKKIGMALLQVAAAGIARYAGLFVRPMAPEVTFVSLQGERISTESLRGKVVLVNFWATDCAICIKEMPELVRTYNKYHAQGLGFVAVAMQHDPPNYVINYAEKNALPFTVALDPVGALAQAFGGVRATPTTFVIDRRGNIVRKIVGEPDFAKLHELIEAKLKEAV